MSTNVSNGSRPGVGGELRDGAPDEPVQLGVRDAADLQRVPLDDDAVAAVGAGDLEVVADPGQRRRVAQPPQRGSVPPADDQLGSTAASVVAPGRYG